MSLRDVIDPAHAELVDYATALLQELEHARQRVAPPDDVHYMIHDVFASRLENLARYLGGAIALAEGCVYEPSFAVLRAALEQMVFDQLLMLGARYEINVQKVTDEVWDQLLEQKNDPNSGIEDIERRSGNARIIFKGVSVRDGASGEHAYVLSYYYGLLQERNPFEAGAEEQAQLTGDFLTLERHLERVEREREFTERKLSWRYLKDNLRINGFLSPTQLTRLEVHYRFLSAYVHLNSHEALRYFPDGTGHSFRPWATDGFAAELVVLYVCAIARRELLVWARRLAQRPRAELTGWEEVERVLSASGAAARYFWFLDDPPDWYDRVEEANHRGAARGRGFAGLAPRAGRMPAEIPEAEVRYYRNPLKRLIRMHGSYNELTGFSYVSPWPVSDPRTRL